MVRIDETKRKVGRKMKAWKHFCTITYHKYLVAKGCFAVGLYLQGLLHDMSKYSWIEFRVGAKYFQGTRSPNNAEREDYGYSSAWLHHKGRNKHHYEYWLDYGNPPDRRITGMRMPEKYVVEMFMDRIAACKVYMKGNYHDAAAWEYYARSKSILLMHDETRALLEEMLMMLAEKGEKETFAYVKKEILKK